MFKKKILISIILINLINNQILSQRLSNIVDFDESMKTSYTHNHNFAQYCPEWKIIRNLYKNHLILNPRFSQNIRIRKKIHWIWLGSPLPERYIEFQKTWKKYHPHWEFQLWTDKDAQTFGMRNKSLFDKATNWGQKSDIFRLEILDREGGLYVDTDFECLKSFDILHHLCDFYTGLGHSKNVVFYNGLIGSCAGHPIIKECINSIQLTGSLTDEDNIQKTTGPWLLTKCFLKIAPTLTTPAIAFPITFFYPFPNSHRIHSNNKEIVNKFIRPESFCIHYWACSWMKN